ncbi:MAG: hypothetical protein ACI8X5_003222 [Planctomycetota bacterium]|jgi:hypothetical protein
MSSRTLAALIAVILIGLSFLFFDGATEESGGVQAEQNELSSALALDTRLPVSQRQEPELEALRNNQREVAAPAVLVVERDVLSIASGRLLTLHCHLNLPDRTQVRVKYVRAELVGADGHSILFERSQCDSMVFEGVRLQRYDLKVEAEGYAHRPQSFDWSDASEDTAQDSTLTERVMLWPPAFLPVVIRTSDGKPFSSLAQDLGMSKEALFVFAFDVRVSDILAGPNAGPPVLNQDLATFRTVPGYKNFELPGAIAGSLELHRAPPVWAGLWVHGSYHSGIVLHADDDQLFFTVDLAAMTSGLASVRLQLLDKDSATPVVDANGTLKADTSAHRRGDQSEQSPDNNGVLYFERVVPGEYELTILREGYIVQRRFELQMGEELDLGEVLIGSGLGLKVRVVDTDGNTVSAWMEVGPFAAGGYTEDLYPPNLHLKTKGDGSFVAPIPDRPGIIRARPLELHGQSWSYPNVGSGNYLIDPDELPDELVIVARGRQRLLVELMSPWVPGQHVTVEDQLGLIVAIITADSSEGLSLHLAPGNYTVRRYDDQTVLGTLPDVTVDEDSTRLRCP